jgi:hypothetical protein
MKENSRIRFNPVTKEIEIEGSESFVKTYFKQLQKMISGSPDDSATRKGTPKSVIAKKAAKTGKKTPGKNKVTNIDKVVTLIKAAPEGIEIAALKKKTGLKEAQIYNIVNRAAKEGKIKKIKRGVYGG